jgi:7-carboxy-7-deazaguanine synthase
MTAGTLATRTAQAGAGGLLVAETFTSLQGEGPSAGQPATFIRLSRCNLSCGFCDTPYTWDWSRFRPGAESRRWPAEELAAWTLEQQPQLVVITGGEPLIQQATLVPLAARLADAGRQIEIETNGTIAPLPELVRLVSQFNVSPKLSGSGIPASRRLVPAALAALAATGKAVFKFVICHPRELIEVAELQAGYGLAPVWVMPEGTSEQAVLDRMRAITGEALAQGWSVSPRLHVLLWGDQRGR